MLCVVLLGCQPRPEPVPGAKPPVEPRPWPPHDYAEAARRGQQVFRLDPSQTQIDIVIRSAGPLARFGHDHAIVVEQPQGYLLWSESGTRSRADLRFDARDLRIDSAAARQRHGLDSEVSAKDIEGTRRNLMEKVLVPGQSSIVTLSLSEFDVGHQGASARVDIFLQGRRHAARQAFRMRVDENRVKVDGNITLRHSDLGLEPYSTLGGGLSVADPIEIHFSLSGIRY